MTWYTDDRRLYWEQRRLDAEQEAASITTNDTRCRWPDCVCYAPQHPQQCRRAEAAESELTTLRARVARLEEAAWFVRDHLAYTLAGPFGTAGEARAIAKIDAALTEEQP